MENKIYSKTRVGEINMQHLSSFGSFLRTARLKRGLTQTHVQRVLNLSSSGVVSHWEKNKSFMSNENARELARIYGLGEEEMMYRLFQAKSLEPTLKKWRQQYQGCRAVLRLLTECESRTRPAFAIDVESRLA